MVFARAAVAIARLRGAFVPGRNPTRTTPPRNVSAVPDDLWPLAAASEDMTAMSAVTATTTGARVRVTCSRIKVDLRSRGVFSPGPFTVSLDASGDADDHRQASLDACARGRLPARADPRKHAVRVSTSACWLRTRFCLGYVFVRGISSSSRRAALNA